MIVAVVTAVVFVVVERRKSQPLVDLSLLATSPGYRTAVISQSTAGAAEMGLGVILPLLLILNLGMPPGLAGLALLPASLPLIFIAPRARHTPLTESLFARHTPRARARTTHNLPSRTPWCVGLSSG